MRVMVTGASGDFGACIVLELLVRGHHVHGISRGPHSLPSPHYTHSCVDVRDTDAVTATMVGADAVVHLAWTTHPTHDAAATRAVDIGGTQAVLDAIERTGVSRLVSMSSVMAYGANADNPDRLIESDPLRPSPKHLYSRHKAEAEGIIAASGVNAILVRATNIMGRNSTGVTQQGFATPVTLGMKGARNIMQFVHPDDVARFVADALERPDWRGPVNLAADDAITMSEIASILGKRFVEFNPKRVEALLTFLWDRNLFAFGPGEVEALVNFPLVDSTRLTGEFGFQPAWSSRDCVVDFLRANREHVFLGPKRIAIPWRWPWARVPEPAGDGPHRHRANDQDGAGEFDTTVDPKWSVFTAANTSEAFPGPMTPLALELSLEALRAGGAQAADILGLDGELRRVLREEQTGAFGHGVYANLTVIMAMSAAMPGADPSTWEDMLFGEGSGAEVPAFDKIGSLALAKKVPGLVARLSALASETRRIDAAARAQQRAAAYYADLTDQQLYSQLHCTGDEVANAWAMAAQASAIIVPIMAMIEKRAGKRFATQIRGGTEKLASAGLSRGTYALAARVRADPELATILREEKAEVALNMLRAAHPRFTSALDAVVAEYGHRGPRETELINPVFADSPARLLDVVGKLAGTEERVTAEMPPMGYRLRLLAGVGAGFQQSRERARDAAIRRTHAYRLIAREIGSRLAQSGVIDDRDDVFYLVSDELAAPPADARERVDRRRTERARLELERPPLNFVATWKRQTQAIDELAVGDSLMGTPVSAGLATGKARVLTVDSTEELEPGEILIAEFTDTGWTPFFSYAGAVVVDTGGEMSHAAIVAREFGIPCVVGTLIGSRALRTGQLVEVDGATGLVTRVS